MFSCSSPGGSLFDELLCASQCSTDGANWYHHARPGCHDRARRGRLAEKDARRCTAVPTTHAPNHSRRLWGGFDSRLAGLDPDAISESSSIPEPGPPSLPPCFQHVQGGERQEATEIRLLWTRRRGEEPGMAQSQGRTFRGPAGAWQIRLGIAVMVAGVVILAIFGPRSVTNIVHHRRNAWAGWILFVLTLALIWSGWRRTRMKTVVEGTALTIYNIFWTWRVQSEDIGGIWIGPMRTGRFKFWVPWVSVTNGDRHPMTALRTATRLSSSQRQNVRQIIDALGLSQEIFNDHAQDGSAI